MKAAVISRIYHPCDGRARCIRQLAELHLDWAACADARRGYSRSSVNGIVGVVPYSGSRRAVASVLQRLGIDPESRFDEYDQDLEYTSCRSEETVAYFRLYSSNAIDDEERAVLCCFLLECLNELFQSESPHPMQSEILGALFAADPLHREELAYWMDTSDPDEENWWPITKVPIEAKRHHDALGSSVS